MIRGIIFDFGNVISAFDPWIFFRAVAPRASRHPEEIAALARASDLPALYERGGVTSRSFFERFCALSGARMEEEEFVRSFNGIFTPIPGTSDLIRRLAGRYRLGLLSNTNAWHFDGHIRRVAVFPLFDAVTLSHEVGALKPEEPIYRDALGKMGLPPEACVYVDDIEEYVTAARGLGMKGIRFDGPDALARDLAALGVDP